jgi:hypothetical protein
MEAGPELGSTLVCVTPTDFEFVAATPEAKVAIQHASLQ